MTALLLRTLVESSIRSGLLALLVAGILAALRVRASGVRHASWTAVLCAMLLMPLLPRLVPALTIPVPPSRVSTAGPTEPIARVAAAVVRPRDIAPRSVEVDRLPSSPGPAASVRSSSPLPADTPPTRSPAGRPFQGRRPDWLDLSIAVYGAGVGIMLFRSGVGWRAAARIARAGQPICLPAACRNLVKTTGAAAIRESVAVATPVTVGAFPPTILLPLAWRQWPDDTRQAILAHELAHVARRDPLVALIAQLNRCLFWFHPLAWWLARTLSAAAEHASDALAVRAIGERSRYASILLEMANTVRERGGRLSWHGVGIDGSRLLGERIERVLRGDPPPDRSRVHNGIVAAGCAAAIVVAIACHPQAANRRDDASASIEQRDKALRITLREIAEHPWADVARVERDAPRRIDALEAALTRNPENLDALKELLVAYWIATDQKTVPARRARILWLIEHHPGAELAGSVEAGIFPRDLDPSFPGDPVGYDQAKTLWLAHAARPDASSAMLGNAAYFFEATDRPLAERMLLRARALDPKGPWAARLGRFYAIVLTGSNASAGKNHLRRLSVAEPRSAYAAGVRRTLGESTDDVLLTAAGWFLAWSPRGWPPPEFDLDAWAEACFRRAVQVNPRAVLAHTALLDVAARQKNRGEPLWRVPPGSQYEYTSALPEAERFARLPHLARTAFMRIESLVRWNDDPLIRDRIELTREQARRYAEDALKLAPRYRAHPGHGTAIYLANMTLGALALRDGDRKNAVRYLLNASKAPVSEELAYSEHLVSALHWHLAADLLKQGERDAVLVFLERMAEINIADRLELREAADAIRRGEMPVL